MGGGCSICIVIFNIPFGSIYYNTVPIFESQTGRYVRGGPFDFWGGGVRKMYLNNLFIFCSFLQQMKQIFYSKPAGHAVSFHDNMSNSVGINSMDVTLLE